MTKPETPERSVRVLVVDDEAPLRSAIARLLSKRGWIVEQASSGPEAIERLADFEPELMLLDIRMPGMAGTDVVPEALHANPDLAILMLTAVADATSAAQCMQRGAYDYLTKPIEIHDLEAALDRAIKRRDTTLQNREISSWLKEEVTKRTRELEHEQAKLQAVTVATLEALVNALEAKNSYLAGHSARVAAFAANIAAEMGLSDDDVEQVRMAGRLHDLGMIGIRESILNKEGRLSDEEYRHIQDHVTIGSQILAPLAHLGSIVASVRSHHEHYDGSGYPDGLAGDGIPIGGRIICASEIYDALTTSRPYQERVEPEEAVDRMKTLEGRVVDPDVMHAIVGSVKRRTTLVFLDDDLQGVD